MNFAHDWLVHSGKAPFMLKKSAKLTRSRAASKTYGSNLQLFNNSHFRTPMRRDVTRRTGGSMYSTPTIEMLDAEEEEKESRGETSQQRFDNSRDE